MLATTLGGLIARPWARRVIWAALVALTVALFLFNLRRSGERAGRAAERIRINWSALMPSNARCWTRPLATLAVAMILLSGCAGVGSEVPPSACPPLVEYSRAEQAKVSDEVAALPEGTLIVSWLADYAVMRDQARACAGLRASAGQ